MPVTDLIIDPQISPNLKRRMITSQILQRKTPRFALINPEYRDQSDTLNSEDTCDVKFLAIHEMLLTKANIQSPTHFHDLCLTYEIFSRDSQNESFMAAFDLSSVATLLKLFDAMSKNEAELLGELNFWATKTPEEVIQHVKKANLKKLVSNQRDLKRFENLLASFEDPQYQATYRVNIQMLYSIHEHFISLGNKVEAFDFINSSKLIWTLTSNLKHSSYMQALAIFAMLSKRTNVYLDSGTPQKLIEKSLISRFTVTALVLNNSSNTELKRVFTSMAEHVYISLQEPNFDILLQKIVQADSELLKINKITRQDLVDYFARIPYTLLVGDYLVYSPKQNKLYTFSTTDDPLKRVNRKPFDLSILLKYKQKENTKPKVEQASKDEKINMPNKEEDSHEIKAILIDMKSELDKLLTNNSIASSDLQKNDDSELLSKISKKIDGLQTALNNMPKVSTSPVISKPMHHSVRDIFGNPEDETEYDIDSAWEEEARKQNPDTKKNDPLQQQFMKNKEIESEMPNTSVSDD